VKQRVNLITLGVAGLSQAQRFFEPGREIPIET
jgi:hypothetical protein